MQVRPRADAHRVDAAVLDDLAPVVRHPRDPELAGGALGPDARDRLATATTSTPGCFCRPGMWNFLVLAPAPTTPDAKHDGSDMT